MNTKFYFVSALASMALLSGCSDNELASVETSQKTPIGFHTVGSQMGSRATIITPSNLTTTDFKVYAFTNDGTAFMGENDTDNGTPQHNGVKIKYYTENNKWDYVNSSDLRYWPTKPLDFYAVNPGSVNEDDFELQLSYNWIINKNKQQINYTTSDEYGPSAAHENIDVMYAIAKNQTQNSNGGMVKFNFKHILSQIAFKAKTQYDDMVVEINGLKIHNVRSHGTFTLPTTDENSEVSRENNWSNNDTYIKVTVGMKNTATADKKDVATDVFTKPMLFVPQELTPWSTKTTPKTKEQADVDHESYIEISCKIKQKGAYLFGDDTNYGTLYVPFNGNWQPGKRYVYTLIFGGGYDDQGQPILSPINFDAETEDWVEDTNNNEFITQ